jgi:N-acetylmuramoyl-L-alanine amidase
VLIRGCIDPGHKKNTPGKRCEEFLEYLSNQNIARKLKGLLEASGFQIVYSCDLDNPVDDSLEARALKARQEDCHFLVSIHSNAGPETARGTETFLHEKSAASKPFADVIQRHLVAALGTKDRGVKRADFGVLRNTYKFMVSCLTEGEFYTNPEARKWMLTEDYENKYAEGVARGICAYYKTPFKSLPEPVVKGAVKVNKEDVEGHWAENVLRKAESKGILTREKGLLNPDRPLTRAELVTVLDRLGLIK